MFTVSAMQVKAARAMLGWSQKQFCDATGLGLNTLRRIESGHVSPRTKTNNCLRQIIENAGLELIDNHGIRKKDNQIEVLHGSLGCQMLCEDITKTIKLRNNDIFIAISMYDTLKWIFDPNNINYDCLAELKNIANVKCLQFSMPQQPYKVLPFEYRMIPQQMIGHLPLCVYGDKYITITHMDSHQPPNFVLYKIPHMAQIYRNSFYDLWKTAQPIIAFTHQDNLRK